MLSGAALGASRVHSRGTIVGAILYAGGDPLSNLKYVRERGTVTLRSRALSRTEKVRDGHRFRFTVPAGRYRLSVKSGDAMCIVGRHRLVPYVDVRVLAGHVQTVNLVCSVY